LPPPALAPLLEPKREEEGAEREGPPIKQEPTAKAETAALPTGQQCLPRQPRKLEEEREEEKEEDRVEHEAPAPVETLPGVAEPSLSPPSAGTTNPPALCPAPTSASAAALAEPTASPAPEAAPWEQEDDMWTDEDWAKILQLTQEARAEPTPAR
jgi:hypothetical protein